MSGELRPWGGDVWVPQWLRRLFRRADAGDTPERMAESGRQSRHADYPASPSPRMPTARSSAAGPRGTRATGTGRGGG